MRMISMNKRIKKKQRLTYEQIPPNNRGRLYIHFIWN